MTLGEPKETTHALNPVGRALAALVLAAAMSSCGPAARNGTTPKTEERQTGPSSTQSTEPRAAGPKTTATEEQAGAAHPRIAPPAARPQPRLAPNVVTKALAKLRNGSTPIQAKVHPYRIAAGLRNVSNRQDFRKELSAAQKRLLASQGFVATPSKFTQLYEIYEANDYARPHRYPSFITTDTLLHAYHLLYDAALAEVETHGLAATMSRLTRALLTWSTHQAHLAHDPLVKRALRRNAAFFTVAEKLLTNGRISSSLRKTAGPDLARVMAHRGTARSSVLGTKVDFTMFVPRGHYTKSKRLQRYFRAMMWYGLASMPLDLSTKTSKRATIQALLMTRALQQAKVGKKTAMDLWMSVYGITKAFVGPADDLSPIDYQNIISKVWAPTDGPDAFARADKLTAFAKMASALPMPRIRQFFRDRSQTEQGRKFRLMGQRFVYDSRILQQLLLPKVPQRIFPTALDVPAAFGSERAKIHALATMSPRIRPAYEKALAQMRTETASLPSATWHSNLYFAFLHTLAASLMDIPAGYPTFMRHPNWQDRTLLTFLGSWTELRHDTILYAKQAVAECGGDEEHLALPKGYVEPNIELWTRLGILARETSKLLRPYRNEGKIGEIRRGLNDLREWTDFCATISKKELTGGKITEAEYEKMTRFGGAMEGLHATSITKGDFGMLTQKERHMALVADVHSSEGTVLEEGVGAPAILYVVVPLGRKLQIARGAVFTHYEFTQPASRRMTDETWKTRVLQGKLPAPWAWLKSLMTNIPKTTKVASRLPEC